MKIATFNANSIRMRLPVILDWLQRESPDVLAIQETKVTDEDFPAVPIQELGYHVSFRGQKAHAGVAIITRQQPENVACGLDDGGDPDEARLIRADVAGVHVVNTYVPQGRSIDSPQFQYKLEWLERLGEMFRRQFTPDDRVVWLGDFNVAPDEIDVYDPKRLAKHVAFHPDARAALHRVKEWGWVDLFRLHHPHAREYTFYDYRIPSSVERGLGWRVDHIWATRPVAERSTGCRIDMQPRRGEKPSDHTFLVAELTR